MIRAYFLTFGNYGFWLPNDERGSWSDKLWAEHLKKFGEATKTDSRRSIAHRNHDRQRRLRAKASLLRRPVRWSPDQVAAVGEGFGRAVDRHGLIVHACAIMPDHTHLVIAHHDRPIEWIGDTLRRYGTRQLTYRNLHPFETERDPRTGKAPTPWAEGHGWRVYLRTDREIRSRIDYTRDNLTRERLPRQDWRFVTEYGG